MDINGLHSPSSTGPHASGDAQHALHADQAHASLEPTTVPGSHIWCNVYSMCPVHVQSSLTSSCRIQVQCVWNHAPWGFSRWGRHSARMSSSLCSSPFFIRQIIPQFTKWCKTYFNRDKQSCTRIKPQRTAGKTSKIIQAPRGPLPNLRFFVGLASVTPLVP